MHKKTNSSASPRRLKQSDRDTKFGRDLIRGAKQILEHVEGRKVLPEYMLAVPVDIKGIRQKIGMSQTEFATAFSLNRRTLQEWEQGKSVPDLAVRAYLKVIERNPAAVQAALRA
jgi:putative transcriptional regulator